MNEQKGNLTSLEIAKFMGKLVVRGKPLRCPFCSDDNDNPEGHQPMSSIGDFENKLFCPHCDLLIDLVVIDRGVTCSGMDNWQEHVLDKVSAFVNANFEYKEGELNMSLNEREAYVVLKALEDQRKYLQLTLPKIETKD